MTDKLNGIAIPLVTPLQEDRSVCEKSVQRLIESVADFASALLPSLSSGEGKNLSRQQWEDMVIYSVRHSRGISVFPGALVESRDELRDRAGFVARAGAAGITLLVPPLADGNRRQVIDDFGFFLESLPVPVFLYNQESDGNSECVLEGLASICRRDKVIAIKESSRRPEIAIALHREGIPGAVLQGWEDLCYRSYGVDGNALALSNLEPKMCAEIYREPTEARQQSMIDLCERYQLFDDAWYVSLKTVLWRRGVLSTNLVAA